jgi:hypothetical protein
MQRDQQNEAQRHLETTRELVYQCTLGIRPTNPDGEPRGGAGRLGG